MKIGIEAQRIFRHKKHGMDFVVLEEIKQLQKIDKRNEYFIFVKPIPALTYGVNHLYGAKSKYPFSI